MGEENCAAYCSASPPGCPENRARAVRRMASRAINSSAVSVISAATRTIGDNRRVELSQTVIFLTSNLGGGEIMNHRSSRLSGTAKHRGARDGFPHNICTVPTANGRCPFGSTARIGRVAVLYRVRRKECAGWE